MVRYRAMLAHWAKHGPPVYMAVARYLGITKAEPKRSDRLETLDDLTNFLGAIPGGAMGARPFPVLEKGPPNGQQ